MIDYYIDIHKNSYSIVSLGVENTREDPKMARLHAEAVALLPRTRDKAIELMSTYYFTGEPCKRGHTTYRYTGNGACNQCTNRFIQKSRVTGVPCAFRIRSHDNAFAADPELSYKIGIILLNDAKLCEWLIARAQAGEDGFQSTRLRFEAGPVPLSWATLRLTEKSALDHNIYTVDAYREAGWSPEQLVAEGYAEIVT